MSPYFVASQSQNFRKINLSIVLNLEFNFTIFEAFKWPYYWAQKVAIHGLSKFWCSAWLTTKTLTRTLSLPHSRLRFFDTLIITAWPYTPCKAENGGSAGNRAPPVGGGGAQNYKPAKATGEARWLASRRGEQYSTQDIIGEIWFWVIYSKSLKYMMIWISDT